MPEIVTCRLCGKETYAGLNECPHCNEFYYETPPLPGEEELRRQTDSSGEVSKPWYLGEKGSTKKDGPLTEEEINKLISDGVVTAENLVWQSEMEDWVPVFQVFDAGGPPPLPSESEKAPTEATPTEQTADTPSVPTAQPPELPSPKMERKDKFTSSVSTETHSPKKANYITRHWRGELSLGVSYWINVILLSIPTTLAAHLFTNWEESSGDPRLFAVAYIAFLVAIFVVYPWQIVGTFRSASKHILRTRRTFWAWVTRIVLVLGLLGAISNLIKSSDVIFEFFMLAIGDPKMGKFDIDISPSGREIVISGMIGYGIAERVQSIMESNPNARIVVLNSLGGRPRAAVELGKVLRGVTTKVEKTCLSGCAIAFLGGNKRILGEGGKLGFHRAGYPKGSDNGTIAKERLKIKSYYRERGLLEGFIMKIMATPTEEMFVPNVHELFQAGVITHILKDQKALKWRGYINIELKDLLKNPVYKEIKTYDPKTYSWLQKEIRKNLIDGGNQKKTELIAKSAVKKSLEKFISVASNKSVSLFVVSVMKTLDILRDKSPDACVKFLFPEKGDTGKVMEFVPEKVIKEQTKAMASVIRSGGQNPKTMTRREQLWVEKERDALSVRLYRQFGEKFDALSKPRAAGTDPEVACHMTIEFYREVMKLKSPQKGTFLRYILSN